MKKRVSFTIDVEPDFGGITRPNPLYFGIKKLPKLETIVRKYNLKLTAFVTGKTLEHDPEILDTLRTMKAEIEQHSYCHEIGHNSKIRDIERGIEIHEKVVGASPLGYRAPQGIITKEEASLLENNGILFDSSIFPTFFPGRFNRLSFPLDPFIIKGSTLMEIPFAVIPRLRIPIALSYMHLMGFRTFLSLLKLCGLPDLIIYDFHTYELDRVKSYEHLPASAKLGYYRAQRMHNDPVDILEKFVRYILAKGYEPKYMFDIYKEFKTISPTWRWIGD